MQFKKNYKLSVEICESFWKSVNDSYKIERLYEESENVHVTLKDKLSTCTFIYFNTSKLAGKGIRILDNAQQCVGVLWLYDNGERGGFADGEKGMRRVVQTLKMLEKAISYGRIELIAIENPLPPSANVPLSPREKVIVEMLKSGIPFSEVRKQLELTPLKVKKIRSSLRQKGIIEDSFDEIA